MTDIDVRILEDRLNRLKENYMLLEKFINITKEEFSKDPKNQRTIIHALQWAIEICIDIGNHIIARKELGVPKDYSDVFDILKKASIIQDEMGEEFKKLARFRNRIVHVYWNINWEEVFQIFQTRIDYFKKFEESIRKSLISD